MRGYDRTKSCPTNPNPKTSSNDHENIYDHHECIYIYLYIYIYICIFTYIYIYIFVPAFAVKIPLLRRFKGFTLPRVEAFPAMSPCFRVDGIDSHTTC